MFNMNQMNMNNQFNNNMFNMNMFNWNQMFQNNNIGMMNNIGGAIPINNKPQMNNFNIPMNKMNNMNCFNNMCFNMNNMSIISPIKGIKNYNNPMEASFVNSVLQSLACLDCIKTWYNNLRNYNFMNMHSPQPSLTKYFFNLLYGLYMGNQVDSSYIINQFIQESFKLLKKQTQSDPYHFLFNFLDLLHLENNYISNTMNTFFKNYKNPDIKSMQNDSLMFNIFRNYYKNTQNSIISQNFFNTFKFQVKCTNYNLGCGTLYRYEIRKMIIFDVDKFRNYRDQLYPQKMGMKLTLTECFQCYTGGYKSNNFKCENCGNFSSESFTSLYLSTKVLIIVFKRQYHSYQCDIDFGTTINISQFCKYNMNGNANGNYILKACISLNTFNKYFADILINGNWFRFVEDNYRTLNNYNEIYMNEPQLLIYELENYQTRTAPAFWNNNAMMMNRGNFFAPFNQLLYRQNLMNLGNFNLMRQNLMMFNNIQK